MHKMKFIRNSFGMKISIRKKIILSFAALILISSAIWTIGYYQYYVLNHKIRILDRKVQIFNAVLEARRYEKNYFITSDSAHLQATLSYVQTAQDELLSIVEGHSRYVLAKNLESMIQALNRYTGAVSALFTLHQRWRSSDIDEDFLNRFTSYQEQVTTLGREVTGKMESMIDKERRYVERLIEKSKSYIFASAIAIFIISFLTGLFLVFNVNRPLKAIEKAIHGIAVGDYQNIPKISSGDEFESLVTSLNHMIRKLNRRHEQLIQREKMASLGTLTSGVAHELNNPLNNIYTSVQIVIEELADQDIEYKRNLLLDVQRQVERATDIVKALLEFSRERTFTAKPVNFNQLVQDAIKLIKGELPANVHLQVDITDQITESMDPRRIQQVLINLILNGVQAMEDGGILRIRAFRNETEGGFTFEVEDSGKGIAKEDQVRIFDPFFTTKDVGQGAGLGLSICLGIVEQHKGRIEVRSEPGSGTVFSVFLPAN